MRGIVGEDPESYFGGSYLLKPLLLALWRHRPHQLFSTGNRFNEGADSLHVPHARNECGLNQDRHTCDKQFDAFYFKGIKRRLHGKMPALPNELRHAVFNPKSFDLSR